MWQESEIRAIAQEEADGRAALEEEIGIGGGNLSDRLDALESTVELQQDEIDSLRADYDYLQAEMAAHSHY